MTRAQIKKIFGYNEDLGKECPLAWRIKTQRRRIGQPVKWSLAPNGYIRATVTWEAIQKAVYAHRLVCLLNSPQFQSLDDLPVVDHINHDKTDNLADNLRPVTASENAQNGSKRRNATSQYWGVSFRPHQNSKNPWFAFMTFNGRTQHIGCYPTEESAALARDHEIIIIFGQEEVLKRRIPLNFPERYGIEENDKGVPILVRRFELPPKPQMDLLAPENYKYNSKPYRPKIRQREPEQLEIF